MLILGTLLVCLLTAAVGGVFLRLLRQFEADMRWSLMTLWALIAALALALAAPMIILFAWFVDFLERLVGTLCPSCRRRELEWQSGNWKYGDPPDYQYFACTNCAARFRQGCGGQGELSELERV
jgi:hypothetical protein